MTVQVQAHYWHKIVEYYTNILNDKFYGQLYTPTTQHFMRQTFDHEVRKAQARETHPAWHVPLQLHFEPLSNRFFIEASDPNTIEIT